MSLPVPPLPPSGRFIEYVRKSSRALTQAGAVTVSVPALVPWFPISAAVVCLLRYHSSFLCAWCTLPLPVITNFICYTARLIWHGRQREGSRYGLSVPPHHSFSRGGLVSVHHRSMTCGSWRSQRLLLSLYLLLLTICARTSNTPLCSLDL